MQSDLPRQNQSFDAGASTTVTSAFARTKAIAFFMRMLSRTLASNCAFMWGFSCYMVSPFCRQMAASSLA